MMRLDFAEFLRIMTCILIILLILQGLDYIFGFGVNNYVFIIFCIIFAFTVGSLYHNTLMKEANKKKSDNGHISGRNGKDNEELREELNIIQQEIEEEYNENGLTDEVLEKQVELNSKRHDLDVKDEEEVVNEKGFVQ